ncbi:TVP38/TMEM64 family protein [Pseudalkalibacillus sp. A8]|uniref:TVP38/TMEM64 family protein n=1 Tax=Pseudalkalibacillus sp. A8 TaxID=3382641 RepID=UPI0038B4D082
MNMVMKMLKYSSIISFFIFLGWIGRHYVDYDTEKLRDWIISFGIFSPVIYVLFCSLRPFIFFPFLILSISGGLAFGVIVGTLLTMTGSIIAAALSFGIARKYSHYFHIQKWKRTLKLQKSIDEKGFYYVLFLRVMPFLNFDLVSYASGLSNVSFRSYLTGTFVGMIPGTFLLNFFGSSLASGNPTYIVITSIVLTTVSLLAYILKKRFKKARLPIDSDQ